MQKTNAHRAHIIYGIVTAVSVLLLIAIPFIYSRTFAACSALPSDKGQATYNVNVPSNGTYRGWVRLMPSATASEDSVNMQVDDSYCSIVVGDTAMAANTFKWVNYQSGNTSNLLTFNLTAGNHTVRLAGREANVGVDRIMFVSDLSCVPTGTGDNCLSASPPPPPPPADAPTVSLSNIINGATVNGNLAIEAIPQGTDAVTQVEFFLDNASVRIEKNPPFCFAGDDGTCFAWDSRGVSNGSHTIKAVMTYSGGTAQTITTFTVNNPTANDTTPPSTPTGVSASAQNSAEVKVTWNPSTDNDGGRGVSFYRIYRNNATSPVGTSTTTTFTDTTASPAKTYNYQVSSVDGAGNESSKSAAATVVTPAATDTVPPTTPKNLRVESVSANKVNLVWDASTDNKALGKYRVYRNGQLIGSPSQPSYGDAKLAPDTTYEYYVEAYDTSGNKSPKSNILKIKTYFLVLVGDTDIQQVLSGIVSLQPAVTKPVTTVEYSVDGKPIQGSNLDTSKLADGSHTIAATVRYDDGTTETITTQVTTNNTWEAIRKALTGNLFWIWSSAGVAIIGGGIFIARRLYIKPYLGA